MHMHAEGPAPHLAPEMAGHFRHRALFIGPNARQAVNDGPRRVHPGRSSPTSRSCSRAGSSRSTSRSSTSRRPTRTASARSAPRSTSRSPRSAPPTWSSRSSTAHAAHARRRLHPRRRHRLRRRGAPARRYAIPPVKLGDVERRIGARVAELVPDGATMQMGIGAIPGAVRAALDGKRDLGVHTEMFTDGVVDLVERGVITGATKEVNRGKIVSAFVHRHRAALRFVARQPDDRDARRPTTPTTRASSAASAAWSPSTRRIEVDLTGQVCADSIGTRLYSGVGGQVDFMRGAALAEEGRAIIALPATACGGARSRIVAHAAARRRRRHHARARADRRHRVRRRRAARPRHRPSGRARSSPSPRRSFATSSAPTPAASISSRRARARA